MNKYFFLALLVLFSPLSVAASEVIIQGPEVKLTSEHLRNVLLTLSPQERELLLQQPGRLKEAIDSTYYSMVAAHRARQNGLADDSSLHARLWHLEINHLTRLEFERLYQQIDAEGLQQAALEKYTVDKDRYALPAKVQLAQILLQQFAPDDQDPQPDLAAAEELAQRLRAGELPFAEAAAHYSVDERSKEKDGVVGWFSESDLPVVIAEPLFALQAGEISEPLVSEVGVHLVTILEREEQRYQPFEQVKDALISELKREAQQRIREDYLLSMRDDEQTDFDHEALERVLEHLDL